MFARVEGLKFKLQRPGTHVRAGTVVSITEKMVRVALDGSDRTVCVQQTSVVSTEQNKAGASILAYTISSLPAIYRDLPRQAGIQELLRCACPFYSQSSRSAHQLISSSTRRTAH